MSITSQKTSKAFALAAITLALLTSFGGGVAAQEEECPYESFLDALGDGIFDETSIFRTAVELSGFKDKLPSPNGPISLTLLIPNNKAFFSMFFTNGLFIPIISKVGDALPATMLYNALVGSISPDQLKSYNVGSPGNGATTYGLLGGAAVGDTSLDYWAEQDGNGDWIYRFKTRINAGEARSHFGKAIQVCKSWIYITDHVLVPAVTERLKNVEPIAIPENLPWENSTPTPAPIETITVASPPPAVPPPPACVLPTPIAPPCDTTLADAAKAAGLTVLATALSQPAIASQLPDPSLPGTFLAPVDAAFTDLLTTFNISIADALGLGPQLAGVILYHIHPSEALTIEQLRGRTSLDTTLGLRLNEAAKYVVSVDATSPDATMVAGLRAGNVAMVQQELKVCAASILVIDAVLLPAETLEALPNPGIAPTATAPPPPEFTTPAPVACDTTLAQAASANGLSILATALARPEISSQMPDPSTPATFLAPVDAAFLTLLTTLNISITEALGLGNKLAGVILYHVHPTEALTIEQLRGRTSLDTVLGAKLNDAATYVISVDATAPGVTKLSGLRAGNVALVTKELQVCAATVLVIDQVLLPAENVEGLPDPGPAPPTTTTASIQSTAFATVKAEPAPPSGGGILEAGVAIGVGQLVDCTIQLTAVGSSLTASTDEYGKFSFPGIPTCALADAELTLLAGAEQLGSCFDAATGLTPPFAITTLLADVFRRFNGGEAIDPTIPVPVILSPLTDAFSNFQPGNSSSPDKSTQEFQDFATDATKVLASLLGLNADSVKALDGFVESLFSINGSSVSTQAVLINSQTLIAEVIGGDLLSSLLGVDLDAAIKALGQVLGDDPKGLLNLGDAGVVQGVFEATASLLSGGGDSPLGGLLGKPANRKLMQPLVDNTALFAAVAEPTAALNTLIDGSTGSAAMDMASMASRCARVAQTSVAPGAASLGAGDITVEQFQQSFSSDSVTKAVSVESTPLSAAPPPESSPVTVITPQTTPPPPAPSAATSAVGTPVIGAVVLAGAMLF